MALDTRVTDYVIGFETPALAREVLAMTDRAFGPGRYTKTAERLREDSHPIADLSFIAQQAGRLLGSVRLWPIFLHDETHNTAESLVFLGPIVVDSAQRGRGIGKALIRAALDAAFAKGVDAVLLVGDRAYFEPLGFEQAPGVVLPGPVDPRRVLMCYRTPGGKLTGRVAKAPA